MASRDGLHDQVEDLLKKGGNPNSEYYKRKHNGWTPLHEACSNNHPQTAKLLLQKGAYLRSLNSDNDIPLKVAVVKNSMECVKILMDHCSPTGELEIRLYWMSIANQHYNYRNYSHLLAKFSYRFISSCMHACSTLLVYIIIVTIAIVRNRKHY